MFSRVSIWLIAIAMVTLNSCPSGRFAVDLTFSVAAAAEFQPTHNAAAAAAAGFQGTRPAKSTKPPVTWTISQVDEGQSLTPDELKLEYAMVRFSTAEIARLEDAIESLRRNTVEPAREIKARQSEINLIAKQPLQVPQLNVEAAKVGDVGRLVGCLDSSSRDRITWKVFQVVDGRNMIVQSEIDSAEKLVWVSGVDTSGITDKSYHKLGQVFEVTGTKQYGTAIGGTNTVLVFSLFSIQDTDAFIAKFKVERPTKKVAATKVVEAPESTTENRTWKDASGKFTLQAKFGGIIGGKVLLVKEDGSKVYLTREQLSEADNKHLDEITKK